MDARAVGHRLRRRRHRRPGRSRLAARRDVKPLRAARRTASSRLFQGTPLLMQLFLVFFGAPLLGLDINPWIAAALGLMLNASAFLGEIWRGCIEAVPRGQWEAATALGLRYPAGCATSSCRRPLKIAVAADRRLPGAAHQGHLARRDHRLHRTHPRRPDRQQRDLPAVPGVRDRRRALLRPVLAVVAAGRRLERRATPPRRSADIRFTIVNQIRRKPHEDTSRSRQLRRLAVGRRRASAAAG